VNVNWIKLAKDWVQWWAVVNTIIIFWGFYVEMEGNFLCWLSNHQLFKNVCSIELLHIANFHP
jgi:hypothetical protein